MRKQYTTIFSGSLTNRERDPKIRS